MSTENEKQALREKLESIEKLEREYEKLKTDKHKLDGEIKPIKQYLEQSMNKARMRKFELEDGEFQVEKVPKKHQTRPTLKMAYKAISNKLGNDAMKHIINKVSELREERKKTATKKASLVIVKTGALRKPRKDKIEKKVEPKRKKKFLKRSTKNVQ